MPSKACSIERTIPLGYARAHCLMGFPLSEHARAMCIVAQKFGSIAIAPMLIAKYPVTTCGYTLSRDSVPLLPLQYHPPTQPTPTRLRSLVWRCFRGQADRFHLRIPSPLRLQYGPPAVTHQCGLVPSVENRNRLLLPNLDNGKLTCCSEPGHTAR